MNRRHFFRQSAGLALWPLVAGGLSACGRDTPLEVKLGESHCAYCDSVIADARFAAQVRVPAGDHHLFDDFGCALRWIKDQTLPEHTVAFWVMDHRGGYWVDAFTAHYYPDTPSPQGYDLAASTVPAEGQLDFAEAKARVLARPA
jgi:hypothetical protein